MSTDRFAPLPEPPYYAVIFTNQRSKGDDKGYGDMAETMVKLAKTQPGFLGVESTRDETGLGITVSYWKDETSIASWKANGQHKIARQSGNEKWYEYYNLRVAKVERSYSGPHES